MKRALARHDAGEALVIPILLRACDWRQTRFAKLRALPPNETPVTSWANQDEAWAKVALGIREALAARRSSAAPPPARARSDALVTARARRARLAKLGESTAEIDQEILALRRALRAGGQLHEGDALGDGRYVLLRRLGKGGFAVVWEAHDELSGERVAIKVLHPDLTREASRVERFFRGARAMAELTHGAVVRVLDRHGEEEGWHYFVMELVPGGDFRQAVLEKRLGEDEVVWIACRVGDALAAGHARGLIHRDVKPANILLGATGTPRLTDFDLALVADTTGGTRTGAMGTFLYAAPELLDRPQDADARVDVYGLGMTAIFGLYGRDLPMTMMRHGDRVIDGLSCGARLKAALRKAVAWERDERFESMTAFCEALAKAEAPPAKRAAARLVPRGKVSERLAAAEPGQVEPMWAVSSPCRAVAWSPSGDLVASGHDDGSVRMWDAVSGQAIRTMCDHSGSIRSVAFSPDGKTLASGAEDSTVRLWDVATGTSLRAFEGHTNYVRSVAFSPDGKTLASGSWDSTVRLWDVAIGTAVRAFEGHTNYVRGVAFSPDGKTLASGSKDKTVRLWDVATGTTLRAFEGHKDSVSTVAFSPDGKSLVSGSSDKTVRLWDVSTGAVLRAFEGHERRVLSVAFTTDGKTIASGSDDKTVRLWDVSTGASLRTFEGHNGDVRSVAFSPDGRTLASGSFDHTARLWDVATGSSLKPFDGYVNYAMAIAFSPDGKTLASGSFDRTARLWDVTIGTSLRAFEGHTNYVMSVAFSPDGKTLASGSRDNTVRLWDATTGTSLRTFEEHKYAVWSVAFSPDGKTLASGSWDNTVRLWDVATGTSLRAFEGHKSDFSSVAFNPDGKTLASGSVDNTLRLWDVATGTSLRAFEGHKSGVLSVAFSPDGKTLASGSYDGTLRLWDVATARCLVILLATAEGWAAFTPDGRYKIGGSLRGAFWHVAGLCRFEPGELDPYLLRLPGLRLPDDASFLALPPGPTAR
jgi:WD40 repeat protein